MITVGKQFSDLSELLHDKWTGSIGHLTIRANEIIMIHNSLQFKERHGYQYETIYIGRAQKDMEAILH